MKYALISPQENDRLCQVEDVPFPVASPLFWVECGDDVTPQTHRFAGIDGIVELPPPPAPVSSGEANGVTEL
jgi:hypothetical protein